MVYMYPAGMDWPHWEPPAAGGSLDPVVAVVGDIQVPGGVGDDADRVTQVGQGGQVAVALAAGLAAGLPGHGVNVPGGHRDAELGVGGRGDLLDPVVPRISDVDVT